MTPARWMLRRTLIAATAVRSWPGPRPAPPVRLLALVAVRDEAANLPGFLTNVVPEVDGIVALDDGSRDGSAALLRSSPAVLEVLRNPVDRPFWDERGNYRRLVDAGLRHRGEWLLSLDADERLERGFRMRAERAIARGARLGLDGYALRFRELWGDADHFRADGVWGAKTQARLFRARPGQQLDQREQHAPKVPPSTMRLGGRLPFADLLVYHRHTIHQEGRADRVAHHEGLDPAHRFQAMGYAYLTDERGLRRRLVPADRGYRDEDRDHPA